MLLFTCNPGKKNQQTVGKDSTDLCQTGSFPFKQALLSPFKDSVHWSVVGARKHVVDKTRSILSTRVARALLN